MGDLGVSIKFTSDDKKLIEGIAKQNAKLERMVTQLKKVNREGRGASKGIAGIGKAAIATVAGFASMRRAISEVNAALQKQQQIRKGAAGRIEEQERTLKQLVQVSNTQEDLNNHLANTKRIRAAGPGITQGRAQGLQFQGFSLGFTNKEIVEIAGFKKFTIDLGPVIEGIAGLGAAFGPKALGGTPRTRVNALLAAAQLSKVDIETIAGEALTAAQPVKGLGGTAAETLAAVSVATVGLKSAEVAATAVARLADVLKDERRFKGKGLAESLNILSGMTESQRKRVIGQNIRAERGAGVLLQNLDKFNSTLAEINRAVAAPPGQGRAAIAMGLAETTQPLAGLIAAQQARERRKAVEEEVLGGPEQQRQQIRDIVDEILARQSITEFDAPLIFGINTANAVKAIADAAIRSNLELAERLGATPEALGRRATELLPPDSPSGRNLQSRFEELGIVVEDLTKGLSAVGSFTPVSEAPE